MRIRPPRSVTRMRLSGRNANPQPRSMPLATVVTSKASRCEVGVGERGASAAAAKCATARRVAPMMERFTLLSRLLALRRTNVAVHFALDHVERRRAGLEHDIVERLRRELCAERVARLVAQFEQSQLPDHVRACLAGHDDVALDLARLEAIVDRLLARPAL